MILNKAPQLAKARADALATVAANRYAASQTFTFAGIVGVACDDLAQSRLTATLAALQLPGVPSGMTVGWEVTPGVFQDFGVADLQAFGAAMLVHVQAAWTTARSLSEAVAAASSLADLQAIDLTAGWPA